MKIMKKKTTSILLTACAAAVISFGLWSCSKDHSSGSSVTLTEANAAQVTTDAVSPATGGLVTEITSASTLYTTVSVNGVRRPVTDAITCGTVKDTTITYVSTGIPSFNYKLGWQYSLSCAVPNSSLSLNFTGTGTYSGLVLGSQFNSTGAFKLTGLDSAEYTYNSTFSRSGVIFAKTGSQSSYTHNLTITSSNIKYNPTTQQIVSGTAKVSIQLANSAGSTFTYGGTITFLGSQTAKLVLNSGTVYNIVW